MSENNSPYKEERGTTKSQKKAGEGSTASVSGEMRAAMNRVFADPRDPADAEADMPSMEELANVGRSKNKTKKEIIDSGSALEKLRLFYASADLAGYFYTAPLSDEEINQIVLPIRNEMATSIIRKCSKEYHAVIDYGKELRSFFHRFQASFALLAVSLNKWTSCELAAMEFTALHKKAVENLNISIKREIRMGHIAPHPPLREWYAAEWAGDNPILQIFDGATLHFDKEHTQYTVDVDTAGGGGESLYSRITREAEEAKETMQDFKAFAVVIEDYIRKSTLKYTPISVRLAVSTLTDERFTRYLVKDRSFFRSELNRRRLNGETITPEEEKRAVIPDYYEIQPDAEMRESCLRLIHFLNE